MVGFLKETRVNIIRKGRDESGIGGFKTKNNDVKTKNFCNILTLILICQCRKTQTEDGEPYYETLSKNHNVSNH